MKIFQGKNRKYRTERVPFPIYSPIACRVAYDGKPESPSSGRRLRYALILPPDMVILSPRRRISVHAASDT